MQLKKPCKEQQKKAKHESQSERRHHPARETHSRYIRNREVPHTMNLRTLAILPTLILGVNLCFSQQNPHA